MRAALRLVFKDLYELLSDPRGLFLCLVVPPVILIMVGQLRTQPPILAVLLAGMPECENFREDARCQLEFALREVENIRLVREEESEFDPLAVIDSGGFDLLVDFRRGARGPDVYVAETDPSRLVWVQGLARGVRQMLEFADHGDFEDDALMIYSQLFSSSVGQPGDAFLFFPLAGNRSVSLVPGIVALVVCFLPFVLAAPSLIREREAHTLEVLLTGPGSGPWAVFTAKCLAPLAASLLAFVVMLLFAEGVYQLYAQEGLWQIALVAVAGILASTLLGVAVSAVAASQVQVAIAMAAYFLGLLLLSGFLYTLDGSSAAIQAFARLSPLTFLLGPMNAWMFGANPAHEVAAALRSLGLQCALFLGLAVAAYQRMLGRV